MKRVHVIGHRNCGKTTLIVDLVRELVRRGLSVGTIKHTSHDHELDVPGKDSHRHRLAGGSPTAVITGAVTALYLPTPAGEAAYAGIEAHYRGCDIVLVEGDRTAAAPKVEVWRLAMAPEPIARRQSDIAALITDDPTDLPLPAWPRSDVRQVASKLLELVNAGAFRRQ